MPMLDTELTSALVGQIQNMPFRSQSHSGLVRIGAERINGETLVLRDIQNFPLIARGSSLSVETDTRASYKHGTDMRTLLASRSQSGALMKAYRLPPYVNMLHHIKTQDPLLLFFAGSDPRNNWVWA